MPLPVPPEAVCAAPADGRRRLGGMWLPETTTTSAYTKATTTCSEVAAGYEAHCCNASAAEPFDPVVVSDAMCFVEAGSHITHAEAFNGAKLETIVSASECVKHIDEFNWQLNPRHPEGEYCYVGAFDGLNALPVLGDGSHQTLNTNKTYMRAFINTEIRGKNAPESAVWAISTNPSTGGFGQPAPAPEDILIMHGAMEQFVDVDRDTLEVINGGQAVKQVYTARGFPYNTVADPDATSAELYTIVTKHSDLHINVVYDSAEPNTPVCDEGAEGFDEEDLRYCGLYGHCGSKVCPKHEYSYETSPGVPAYGQSVGVGFEDDLILVAQEGGSSFGPSGTVQVLDVANGHWYQLPHLSVGVIEMAFSISTGHPDYVAVGIEDYGDSECGSGWTVWIGKKDQSSSHFLDRNGLGINQGRLYRFVAGNGETDMATFVDWPNSGKFDYEQVDRLGTLEPIDAMFDGRYGTFPGYSWTRQSTNCALTVSGKTPIRMTGVSKQEWGDSNPDKPNQWAIAETGLGYSKPDYLNGSTVGEASGVPMGSRASTLIFLEAEFAEALEELVVRSTSEAVTSRNGSPMPSSIPAKVYHVMADHVVLGPDRDAGLSYVDSLFWGKGDMVYFAEDSRAPGGYNVGGVYNVATRKSVTLAGAIGNDNRKMNTVANFPFGSFHSANDQELTGWFDASAALTLSIPYTPQEYYDALTGKHMILDNQMKGYGEGCMDYGFYYSAQMMSVEVPTIDWETTSLAAPVPTERRSLAEASKHYGKFRRGLKKAAVENCFEVGEWTAMYDEFDHEGCQMH